MIRASFNRRIAAVLPSRFSLLIVLCLTGNASADVFVRDDIVTTYLRMLATEPENAIYRFVHVRWA